MNIRIYDTYDQMSRAAADFVIAQLLLKPESHIGLTAGKTPVGMFAALVDSYRSGAVGFGQATFYNLEENSALPPTIPPPVEIISTATCSITRTSRTISSCCRISQRTIWPRPARPTMHF